MFCLIFRKSMNYKYVIEYGISKGNIILDLLNKNNSKNALFHIKRSKTLFVFDKIDEKNRKTSIIGLFSNKNSKAYVKSYTKKKEKILKTIRKANILKRESYSSINRIIGELKKIKHNKIGDLRIYRTNKNFYKIFDKEFNNLKSIK